MIAYKCDLCGEFKEGEPEESRDYQLQDRMFVLVAVGIKAPPAEDVEDTTLPPGDDFLSFVARQHLEGHKEKDRRADLCSDCFTAAVEGAIRKAAYA